MQLCWQRSLFVGVVMANIIAMTQYWLYVIFCC